MGEDEKRDNQEVESQKQEMQDTHKKANKSKFKMLATIITFIVSHFLAIILSISVITILLLFLDYILDEDGDNKIADTASETVIKEDVSIVNVPGSEEYYFKIDQEVYEKYLEYLNKAYYEGYYHYDDPDIDKKEFVYDKENAEINENDLEEWFKTTDSKKYIVKMIRAQIASSYPKLSDYEGKINKNVDPLNPIDGNGDYVAQGVAEIWRTKIKNDGSTEEEIKLTYLPYDRFHQLVKDQKPEALDHFSFDENSGLLYYAIYRQETVTVNGVDSPEKGSYILIEESKSYKTITKLCDMPFNFLFPLLQESENPNYLMAVIDLLMKEENTKVKLMIQDELSITTLTKVDTEYHAQKTVTTTHTSDNTSGNTVSYTNSTSSYSFPAGTPVDTTEVVKTYENTAKVFIKEAYTWCIDYEQAATQPANHSIISGEELSENYTYSQSELAALSYPEEEQEDEQQNQNQASYTTSDTSLSFETLLYKKTNKEDHEYYTHDIVPVTEKRINYEKFLGLWKNDRGEYYDECKYDPNGKEVKFDLPEDNEKEYNFPVIEIPEYDEMRIDSLIDLLSSHEDTEMHEELMKYYWNIYMNEDMYEVNVDEILNLFDTNLLKTVSGSKLENYIKSWENTDVWKYETGAYSTPPLDYMSEDALYYKVFEDGSNGHNNISYGIATFITNPGNVKVNHPKYGGGYYNWQSEFSSRGVDVTTLDAGSLVAKDVADAVFLEILAGFESEVDTYLSNHGITLSQNQRDALVAVCYQYGNILGFADAYQKSLDEQGNIDPEAIKENFILVSNGNEKPFDYSSKSDRKYANWYLFTQGIYTDRSGDVINAVGGSILECAKQIHDYMSDPSHLYYYCLGGSESSINEHRSAGISNCGLSANFANSQVPGNYGYRLTCCATFVSWVLQEAGELDAHADGVLTLANYLKGRGWSTVSSYSDLQPADVVIMDTEGPNNGSYDHVQLYVGNGTWYNAGGNWSIHQVEPYSDDVSDEFVFALRAPN